MDVHKINKMESATTENLKSLSCKSQKLQSSYGRDAGK